MRSQRTIKKEIYIDGIGLHTGKFCRVVLRPASKDHGIVFQRADRNITFRPKIRDIVNTAFATTIVNNDVKIQTVEHLLATISALGIDNLVIEIEGTEIPVLDGSAIEFVKLIKNAGILDQERKMPYIKITKPVFLKDTNSEIAIYPFHGRKITFRLHFKNHFLGEQKFAIELDEDSFIKGIAPARTFGFLKDVEYLLSNGFAKGGSLDNAVVFSEDTILNESSLRFKDECVRHKILDMIGDLSLIGFPIHGHIVADRSGHTTNVRFLKKLLSSTECWEVVTEPIRTSFPVFSFSYT